MTDLLAARYQMGLSLAFHIVFASIGMAMPFLMAISHWKWIKTGDPIYKILTKSWTKGVAIFFATGAVSGTMLAFELGLLWPHFMEIAGPIFGLPFALEGTAFFLEAIALGLFLYGWDKLPPKVHWFCGLMVGISGVASGFFVLCANGWMNTPTGFDWVDGKAINIDPISAMFNPAAFPVGLHMIIASFAATGFAVAGVHAFLLLRHPQHKIHFEALKIAFLLGAIASLLQPLSGDWSAKSVAERQPIKLAAMEGLFDTQTAAPFAIGGYPDLEKNQNVGSIEIPGLLSFIAKGNFSAEVKGLNDFPKELWPPVFWVRMFFQLMVAIGVWLLLASTIGLWIYKKDPHNLSHPRFLKLLVCCCPLGFVAIQSGWMVTELGRQPWVIYEILKTHEAVTPITGLTIPLVLFSSIYLGLSLLVIWLMKRQIQALHEKESLR